MVQFQMYIGIRKFDISPMTESMNMSNTSRRNFFSSFDSRCLSAEDSPGYHFGFSVCK